METHTTHKTKRDNFNKMKKKRKIEEETSSTKGIFRKIQLYCPTVSKFTEILANEDQRLDLGSISRKFGLQPSTLKLNGHFISRGLDLVATCVTWKSLLSYFSSKGFSSASLIVDGNLALNSSSNNKRSHEPAEIANGFGFKTGSSPQDDTITSPRNKKLKESNNDDDVCQLSEYDNTGSKRKQWLDRISPSKRVRADGDHSKENSLGHESGNKEPGLIKLCCGHQLIKSLKRSREDEVIMVCKRTL